MKLLSIVVHEAARDHLAEILAEDNCVRQWNIILTHGHYSSMQGSPFETMRDKISGDVPRVQFDILLDEENIPELIDKIRLCDTCNKTRGTYWITNVESHGDL